MITRQDPMKLHEKGNTFFNDGKYPKAIGYYEKAIEAKPDFIEAWNNKGNALSHLKKYEEAMHAVFL